MIFFLNLCLTDRDLTSPRCDTCVVVVQCRTTSAAVSRPGSAGQDEDRDPGRGDGGGGRGH